MAGCIHLALVYRDMERTVDFYANLLNIELKKGFDLAGGWWLVAGSYAQHFFFDMGGSSDLAFFWFRNAPDAVPFGFHAAWIDQAQLDSQKASPTNNN